MVQANNFTFSYDKEHLGLNSRQNSVLVVIIILCIIICIGLYFISVNNDYNDLQSFYFSFLERKSLICEGRMAHRQDLERMAPVQAADLHHQLDSNNMRSELPGLVTEPESDDFMMRSLRPGLDPGQCELGLVEDQPLEWAKLDYHVEERERRQSLYEQFRLWKRWKGNKFFVVVTQGAKREMAEAEKEAQKKLNQRTKFEHAQKYRKARDKHLKKYCKKY